MKKEMLALSISFLLLIIAFTGCIEDKNVTLSIQQLIDDALPGDTINIPSGTYSENVTVDKTITLVGEIRETTIIDGFLTINADEVSISGFTVRNGGIAIMRTSNNSITDNTIEYYTHPDGYSILLWNASNNIISNNTFTDNNNGILLQYSNNNYIFGNSITNNSKYGIEQHASEDNNIINNYIVYNTQDGIFLDNPINNIITGNTIANNNQYGISIHVLVTNNNTIHHNNFINNMNGNAYDEGNNSWYNVTLAEGNYWSNYNGTDSNGDGIGDTPYLIPGGSNQDNYPFMNPVDI